MAQFVGSACIRVDGREWNTLDGASLNYGGASRSTVKGHRVYGFKETPTEATIDCKIAFGKGDSLDEINRISNATVEFETDLGQTYMLVGAWRDGEPATLSSGEVSVKFAAKECRQI